MDSGTIDISLPDGSNFTLVLVAGGDYPMGDDHLTEWERPVHRVRVSPFYMGKYPVTQRLWQSVMGDNPSNFKGEGRPVETVSWHDTQKFFRKLNGLKWTAEPELTGTFRLPTEAEWEYAARGGGYSQQQVGADEDYLYAGSDRLKQVGWYNENGNSETHEAGLLMANELGLHDMSGNVWEWCADWFDENYYAKCKTEGVVADPPGAERGVDRVVRGGSYFFNADGCHVAYRYRLTPGNRNYNFGFRLVLSSQSVGLPPVDSRELKEPGGRGDRASKRGRDDRPARHIGSKK